MVRLAGRDGQGWKARLDQSDWVDGESWVADEPADGREIEFLESEPSAYRLTKVDFEQQASSTPLWARLLGFGAVGVVLLALAIMSRPGSDPIDELPARDQQAIRERRGETTVAPSTEGQDATTDDAVDAAGSDGADGEGSTGAAAAGLDQPLARELSEIPPIRDDLPAVPGALFGFGLDGSIVRIDRTLSVPQEAPLELSALGRSGAAVGTSFGDGYLVIDDAVAHRLGVDGTFSATVAGGNRVLPADDGGVVVVAVDDRAQTAYVVPAGAADILPPDEASLWSLGRDLQVLGGWRDRLLVTTANRVWLLDRDGRSTPVSAGRTLGFDGDHLVMLDCQEPGVCRIEVGPPDNPSRRSVLVPETLADLAVDSWGSALDVSPDGDRLALRSIRGVVALPVVIDLVTGEATSLSDSMNHSSAVVFSPDGEWLAYSFSDDLVIMNLDEKRRWRVFTERRMDQLAWLPSPEIDAALAEQLAAEAESDAVSGTDAVSDTEGEAEPGEGATEGESSGGSSG